MIRAWLANVSKNRALSLRVLAGRSLLYFLLSLLLASLFMAWRVKLYVHEREQMHFDLLVQDRVALLSSQIDAYRDIVRNLARSRQVKDVLTFADHTEAERWAREHRPFLPYAVGLALTDAEGRVLGNPPGLRVGPACQLDLQKRVENQGLSVLPAHFNLPGMEHFDVAEFVQDEDGEQIGQVFASFRLQTLQILLEAVAYSGMSLQLLDALGQELARIDAPLPPNSQRMEKSVILRESGWHLRVKLPKSNVQPLLASVVISAVFIFVVLVLLMALLQWRIIHAIRQDVRTFRQALHALKQNQPHGKASEQGFRLRENAALLESLYETLDEIREHQQQLVGLGLTDELTGLPNRRAFNQRAPLYFDMAREDPSVVLVLFDLDDFKRINDKLGHPAGDHLLRLAARVLSGGGRESDFIARLGGDEFVYILLDMDEQALQLWFKRLQENFHTLQQREMPEWQARPFSFSAGFAFIRPEQDLKVSNSFKRADQALYRAKAEGKGILVGDA